MTTQRYDAIVIGGGHNGLINAAYLARAGTPAFPAELAEHAVIAGPTGSIAAGWTFHKDGRTLSVRVEGRVTVNANEGAVAAAVAGLGIVSTGHWGCRAELASGTLMHVLPDWQMEGVDVHAVFAAGRAAAGKDFAKEVALARKACTDHGMQIGLDGVQLLGGHGFVKEHPVERWYRDLRAISIIEGGVLV